MKVLKFINAFALGLPFLLAALGFIDEDLWFWAAYSTMLTGFLQVSIALCALIMGHYRNLLLAYFIAVIIYFSGMYLNVEGYYLYYVPVLLAIFLTVIIYKTAPNEP
jgi:hypothetical protein